MKKRNTFNEENFKERFFVFQKRRPDGAPGENKGLKKRIEKKKVNDKPRKKLEKDVGGIIATQNEQEKAREKLDTLETKKDFTLFIRNNIVKDYNVGPDIIETLITKLADKKFDNLIKRIFTLIANDKIPFDAITKPGLEKLLMHPKTEEEKKNKLIKKVTENTNLTNYAIAICKNDNDKLEKIHEFFKKDSLLKLNNQSLKILLEKSHKDEISTDIRDSIIDKLITEKKLDRLINSIIKTNKELIIYIYDEKLKEKPELIKDLETESLISIIEMTSKFDKIFAIIKEDANKSIVLYEKLDTKREDIFKHLKSTLDTLDNSQTASLFRIDFEKNEKKNCKTILKAINKDDGKTTDFVNKLTRQEENYVYENANDLTKIKTEIDKIRTARLEAYKAELKAKAIKNIREGIVLNTNNPNLIEEETLKRLLAYTGHNKIETGVDYKVDYKSVGGSKHENGIGLGDILLDPRITKIIVKKGKKTIEATRKIRKGRVIFVDKKGRYIATRTGNSFQILEFSNKSLTDADVQAQLIKEQKVRNPNAPEQEIVEVLPLEMSLKIALELAEEDKITAEAFNFLLNSTSQISTHNQFNNLFEFAVTANKTTDLLNKFEESGKKEIFIKALNAENIAQLLNLVKDINKEKDFIIKTISAFTKDEIILDENVDTTIKALVIPEGLTEKANENFVKHPLRTSINIKGQEFTGIDIPKDYQVVKNSQNQLLIKHNKNNCYLLMNLDDGEFTYHYVAGKDEDELKIAGIESKSEKMLADLAKSIKFTIAGRQMVNSVTLVDNKEKLVLNKKKTKEIQAAIEKKIDAEFKARVEIQIKRIQENILKEIAAKDKNNSISSKAREINFSEVEEGQDIVSYKIIIDGVETNYCIEFKEDDNTEKLSYVIKKKDSRDEDKYEQISTKEKLGDDYKGIIKRISEINTATANINKVKEPKKRVSELNNLGKNKNELSTSKAGKIENLTVDQYRALEKFIIGFNILLKTASDRLDFAIKIEKIYKKNKTNISKSPFLLIEFKTNPPLIIDLKNFYAGAIDIKEIKKNELGENSKEFIEFIAREERTEEEFLQTVSKRDRLAKYAKEEIYITRLKANYNLDNWFDGVWEGGIAKNWGEIDGSKEVDKILGEAPFKGVRGKGGTSSLNAEIISRGKNHKVEFAHIFEHSELNTKFKALPFFKTLTKDQQTDADDFIKLCEILKAKGNKRTASEEKLYQNLKKHIVVPCIDLLEAYRRLKPSKQLKEGKVKPKEMSKIIKEEIQTKDKIFVKNLQEILSYSENRTNWFSNTWADFMGLIAGAEKLTLANINGENFDIDEGLFKKYYDSEAALSILLKLNEFSEINSEGKRVLKQDTILNHLNLLMAKGRSIAIGQWQEKLKKEPENEEFKEKLKAVTNLAKVTNLENVTDHQKFAIQMGFVIDQELKSKETISEFNKNIDQLLKGEPESLQATLKDLFKKLREKNELTLETATNLKTGLKAMVAFHVHQTADGNTIAGAGIGVPIRLNDRLSLTISGALAGGGGDGKIIGTPGIGLNFNIYRSDDGKHLVNTGVHIDILGIGTGVGASHEGEDVTFYYGVGIKFNWAVLPLITGGLNLGLDWHKQVLNKNEQEAYEKEGKRLGKVGTELRNWPNLSDIKKLELIEQTPEFNKQLDEAVKQIKDLAGITDPKELEKHKLEIANLRLEQIKTDNIYREVSAPFIGGFNVGGVIMGAAVGTALGPGGVAIGAAIGAIAGVKLKIGQVEIFIPHRKEKARALDIAANYNATNNILKALEAIERGEGDIYLKEKFSNVYYRPGQRPGIRISSKEIDLSDAELGLSTINKNLAKVQLKIERLDDGKHKLTSTSFNLSDLEIHLDPLVKKLGLAVVDGDIIIEGNLQDLIITNESFTFPRKQGEKRSNIIDVICIRQKSSMVKKIDRAWVLQHEEKMIRRLAGRKHFRIEKVNIDATKQKNITNNNDDIKELKEHNKLEETEKLQAVREGDVKNRREALGAVTTEEYEKVRENFEDLVKTKYYKDSKIKYAVRNYIDNPDKIAQALIKHDNTLNEKEISLAISILMNEWFTNIYKKNAKIEKLKLDKTIKLKLKSLKSLEGLIGKTPEEIKKTLEEKTPKISVDLKEAAKIKKAVDNFAIEHNEKLAKHLEGVRNYEKGKFRSEFAKIKSRKDPKINSSSTALANKLMNDIYDGPNGILKTLRKKDPPGPYDFYNPVIKKIENGADILSGSRTGYGDSKRRAIAKTMNFENYGSVNSLKHAVGFLNVNNYSLKSKNPLEKDLAAVLVAMTVEMPKSTEKLLKTKLAVQILASSAHRYLAGPNETEARENYLEITKKLNGNPVNKTIYNRAMKSFKSLYKAVRHGMITGQILVLDGVEGRKIRMDFTNTEITSGAFSRCGNPTVAIVNKGNIHIPPEPGVTTNMTTIHETIDFENGIVANYISLMGGFSKEFSKKTTTGGGQGQAGGEGGGGQRGGGDAQGGAGQEVTSEQSSDAATAGW